MPSELDEIVLGGRIGNECRVIGEAERDEELRRLSDVSSEVQHTPKAAIKFHTKPTPAADAETGGGSGASGPSPATTDELGDGAEVSR